LARKILTAQFLPKTSNLRPACGGDYYIVSSSPAPDGAGRFSLSWNKKIQKYPFQANYIGKKDKIYPIVIREGSAPKS